MSWWMTQVREHKRPFGLNHILKCERAGSRLKLPLCLQSRLYQIDQIEGVDQ
jgi:hypothetical protein